MHEINGSTAVNNQFVDGTSTQNGTVVTADWLNTVQEEICNLITSTGTALNSNGKDDCTQLTTAIHKIITNAISNFVFQNDFNTLLSRVTICEEKIKQIIGDKA